MKYAIAATVLLATVFVALLRAPIPVTNAQSAHDPSTQNTAAKGSIAGGKAAYTANCGFCHGADAVGGPAAPSLITSTVVKNDKNGELILPIVHGSRGDKGMPSIPIPGSKVVDIAAWLHSLKPVSTPSISEAPAP